MVSGPSHLLFRPAGSKETALPGASSQTVLRGVFSIESSAPFGAGFLCLYGFHGLRSGEAPLLHPWLQSGAPSGR